MIFTGHNIDPTSRGGVYSSQEEARERFCTLYTPMRKTVMHEDALPISSGGLYPQKFVITRSEPPSLFLPMHTANFISTLPPATPLCRVTQVAKIKLRCGCVRLVIPIMQEAKEDFSAPFLKVAGVVTGVVGFVSRFLPKSQAASPTYADVYEEEGGEGVPSQGQLLAEPVTAEVVEDDEREYAALEQKQPNSAKTRA